MDISFNITNVAASKTTDMAISVVNTPIAPVVKKAVTDADVPLFYYKGKELTIDDIVNPISDDFGTNNVFVSNDTVFDVRTSNIKITNIINGFSDETIPLWYYHNGISYLSSISSGSNIVSMRLLTMDRNEVDNRLWKYSKNDSMLYTSVKNEIDIETGNEIIYFVETVYDNGVLAFEILNAVDVIRKTSISSIIPRFSVDNFLATVVGVSGKLYVFEDVENAFDMKVSAPIESGVYNLSIRKSSVKRASGQDIVADDINYGSIENLSSINGWLIDNYTIKINIPGSLLVNGNPLYDTGIVPASYSNITVYVYDSNNNLKKILTNYDAGGAKIVSDDNTVEYGFNIKSLSSDGYLLLDIPLDSSDRISVSGKYFSTYYKCKNTNLRTIDGVIDIYNVPFNYDDPFTLSQTQLGDPYIHVGSVSVNNSIANNDVFTLDLRERGGGLDKNKLSEASSIHPEVIFFNDVSGLSDLSLHVGPSYIVEIPGPEILDSINGVFSDAKVDNIVQRTTNINTTAIKRFYNIKPTMIDVEYGSLFVDLTWIDIEGFSYRIWVSLDNNNYVDDSGVLSPTVTTYRYTYSASQQNTMIYVKIEGLYTDSASQIIDGNFSDIYTIMLL